MNVDALVAAVASLPDSVLRDPGSRETRERLRWAYPPSSALSRRERIALVSAIVNHAGDAR